MNRLDLLANFSGKTLPKAVSATKTQPCHIAPQIIILSGADLFSMLLMLHDEAVHAGDQGGQAPK